MKTFRCHCGNTLHFENTHCFTCNHMIGFVPDEMQLSAFVPVGNNQWQALLDNRYFRKCKNYSGFSVCNWMVPVNDSEPFCVSCRLNHVIPNLEEDQNLLLWHRIERAKRRLLYTLYSLNLPVIGRKEDPKRGLAFEFLQDETVHDEFTDEITTTQSVITGHRAGMITINVQEAEPSSREEMRDKMNERYRTLLGHFRHESGHYYWDRVVRDTADINSFRLLFGDERADYQQALKNYYASGPSLQWSDKCISAYASSHPWEDWAETWAHYLHMVDTVETAHDFGFRIGGHDVSPPPIIDTTIEGQMASGYNAITSFEELFDDWCRLSVALNSLNRSMGITDAYPFVISNTAREKLQYVHKIVARASN